MSSLESLDNTSIDKMMQKAVKFHGHSCPGLAIGLVASKIALEYSERSKDEELVAIVENDACGVDAIQALTGCTYGKGNLIHKDYGKSVYTFYYRDSGNALRLSLKPEVFSSEDNDSLKRDELRDKVRNGTAIENELAEHKKLREEHTKAILATGKELFNIKKIEMAPPEMARFFDNILCAKCGEPVMETRVREKDGKKFCIPCFNELKLS